ncbi:MAG: hypothetical protein KDJ65_09805 [Anaerolineae bacterium]|nr:hypothetical protein [Anaerolineae bacterium]
MNPLASADLRANVHKALKCWHKANDETSPLEDLYLFRQAAQNQTNTARRMTNELLLKALKALEQDYDYQAALILRLRFIEDAPIYQVAHQLNLADPTIQRKQRQAIEALTDILYDLEQQAIAAASYALEKQLKLPVATKLFGSEARLDQIATSLLYAEPAWLVAIEGIGGIGKTALAAAVVRRLALSRHFYQFAWISAKQHEFWPGMGIQPTGRPVLNQETLVEELTEQLCGEFAIGLSPQQKLMTLTEQLKKQPYLVVIDNLETTVEYETLLPLLRQLANPTKFLLTTRTMQPRDEVARWPLTELSQVDTMALLQHEATLRQMPALAAASATQLERIYKVVGGNPLALKLVVGQLHSLPLQTVLDNLKEAQGKKIEELYTYIYRQAWQSLDEAARHLLLVMPLVQNGTAVQLAAASGLENSKVSDAIEHLIAVSLFDVSGNLDQRRYRIHRLTETFLLNEVVKWQVPP